MSFNLLAWSQTEFHPSRAHIVVAAHNCEISLRSGVHPHSFPLTNPSHSLLSCTILSACLTSKPIFLKHSFTVSVHLFQGLLIERLPARSPLSYIDYLGNPISLYPLHMTEPPGHAFISPFHVAPSSLRTTPLLVHSGPYPSP